MVTSSIYSISVALFFAHMDLYIASPVVDSLICVHIDVWQQLSLWEDRLEYGSGVNGES